MPGFCHYPLFISVSVFCTIYKDNKKCLNIPIAERIKTICILRYVIELFLVEYNIPPGLFFKIHFVYTQFCDYFDEIKGFFFFWCCAVLCTLYTERWNESIKNIYIAQSVIIFEYVEHNTKWKSVISTTHHFIK